MPEIPVVMVPIDVIHAVGGLEGSQGAAGRQHVRPGGIVVHIIAHHHHHVGPEGLDSGHGRCEAVAVQGDPQVCVRHQHHPQGVGGLLGRHGIVGLPDAMGRGPARPQIESRQQDGHGSGVISPGLPVADALDHPGDQITQEPEESEMQYHDEHRIEVDEPEEEQKAHRPRRQQPGQAPVGLSKPPQAREAPDPGDEIEQRPQPQRRHGRQQCEPHAHPILPFPVVMDKDRIPPTAGDFKCIFVRDDHRHRSIR